MDIRKNIVKELPWYLGVAMVVLFPLVVLIILSPKKTTFPPQSIKTPSPTIGLSQPITPTIQYSYPTSNYKIVYPTNWSTSTYDQNTVTNATFTESGKEYKFTISPPGQINPEGITENTTTEKTVRTYNGELFIRTIWKNNNVPFFIEAIPNNIDTTPYFFSMELPPSNTDKYITLFDQTMATWVKQ